MDKRKSKCSVDMNPLLKRNSQQQFQNKDNIYQAWLTRDLSRFTKALEKKQADFSHCFEEHDGCTIVDLIVQSPDCSMYLQPVIASGYNPNWINPTTNRISAHYAAECANVEALKILLDAGVDLNIQNSEGDTALHLLVKRWDPGRANFEAALLLLLNRSDVSVNVPNKNGLTPISLAAGASEAEIVAEFLRLGPALDLDTFRSTEDHKTSREIILKNFPGLEDELPDGPWEPDPEKGINEYKFRLFYFLKTGQELKFIKTFQNLKIEINGLLSCWDEQRYTLLQHACEKGYSKTVKTLVKAGADVNLSHMGTPSPILLATQNGRGEVVNYLLSHEKIDLTPDSSGETLLHAIVRSQEKSFSHYQILRKLVRHDKIDINAKDAKGRTALHFAVAFSDEKTVFCLLDNGAKLDNPNNYGETPLCQISSQMLRKYLDGKITANKELPKHCEFAYIFDYKFAASKKKNHIYGASTDLLAKIADSRELRELLSHPVYATIIHFKWHRVRLFFYLDLFFYSLFAVFLTCFIFLGPTISKTPCSNVTEDETYFPCVSDFNYVLTVESFLLLFLSVLAFSEFFQFLSTPSQYFLSIENWLQIAIIITSTVSIILGCPKQPKGFSFCNDINAFAIFFAWFEFFFVVGKHPKLTFYVDMFRTASYFLLRFLVVHTSLILAFAFSFYVLFREFESPFTTVQASLFKTVIMITGEYDVGDIPLDSVPITSHILFAIFLFLVAIVLFNLLIGLAVSATRPIEDDAFLYSCIAQVPIISFFENIFFNDSHFCKRLLTKFLSCKDRKEPAVGSPLMVVYPNQNNRMEVRCQGDEKIIPIRHHLTQKIIQDAQSIITSKQDEKNVRCDRFDEMKNQMNATQNALEEEMKTLKTGLLEILEKLEGHGNEDVDGQARKRRRAKADVVLRKLRSYGLKREQKFNKFSKQDEEYLRE